MSDVQSTLTRIQESCGFLTSEDVAILSQHHGDLPVLIRRYTGPRVVIKLSECRDFDHDDTRDVSVPVVGLKEWAKVGVVLGVRIK